MSLQHLGYGAYGPACGMGKSTLSAFAHASRCLLLDQCCLSMGLLVFSMGPWAWQITHHLMDGDGYILPGQGVQGHPLAVLPGISLWERHATCHSVRELQRLGHGVAKQSSFDLHMQLGRGSTCPIND